MKPDLTIETKEAICPTPKFQNNLVNYNLALYGILATWHIFTGYFRDVEESISCYFLHASPSFTLANLY